MLVTIDKLTQFLKLLLINLRNLSLKNTLFKGEVKFHLPLGDKGLKPSQHQSFNSSEGRAYGSHAATLGSIPRSCFDF